MMPRVVRTFVVLTAVWAAWVPGRAALACGDKFVRVGRGARYQRGYVALHPGTIILYMGSGAAASGTLKGLDKTLKAAGHKVVAVKNDGLAGTLRNGKHDLVLADLQDAPRVAQELRTAPDAPQLLPILKKTTPESLAAAQKEWAHVVQDQGDKNELLKSIDALLEKRK